MARPLVIAAREFAEKLLKQETVPTAKTARTIVYLLRIGKAEGRPIAFEPLPWHEMPKDGDLANLGA